MKNMFKVLTIVVIALLSGLSSVNAKTNLVEVTGPAADLVGITIKYKAPDSTSKEPYLVVFFKTNDQGKKGTMVFRRATPQSVTMKDGKVIIQTSGPDEDVKFAEFIIEVDKTYSIYHKKNGDVFQDNNYFASK